MVESGADTAVCVKGVSSVVEWAVRAVRGVGVGGAGGRIGLTSERYIPVQEASLEDEAQDAGAADALLLPTCTWTPAQREGTSGRANKLVTLTHRDRETKTLCLCP